MIRAYSGIRERLALFAAIGPECLDQPWRYDPSVDVWRLAIEGTYPQYRRLPVRQEGSESLALIFCKWGIDESTVLKLID